MMDRFSIPGKKREDDPKSSKQKKSKYNVNTEGNLSLLMPELRSEVPLPFEFSLNFLGFQIP